MAYFIENILNVGANDDIPQYLKIRVRPTNIICLMVIFILAIPFVIISLMYFPRMAIFPAGGGVVAAVVLIINYLGGIYYSRLVLPILLLVLSSLYNAFFSNSISDSIVGVYLVELSFTLIPFIVFDFREKGFLWFCTAFSFFIIVIFPLSWQYFDMNYDGTVLREGPLAVLTVLLSLVFQLMCITGLAFINQQSEIRFRQLFQEMSDKNTEIEQARKNLETSISQLQKLREEEKDRQWVAEGITKVSTLLRSQHNEAQLYDQITAMIVKYVQANQAGFYVIEGNSPSTVSIQLAACYAYDRKKHIKQSFAPGQGMIGQVYLEQEYSYFTDLQKCRLIMCT